MESKYPIRVVAGKTGLSAHLIRMWERRYTAVEPSRTGTKRRMYSDSDVQRLILLRRATQAGANIGQIANLPDEQLRELVASYEQIGPEGAVRVSGTGDPEYFLRLAFESVEALDARSLESALLQASVALGRSVLLERVLKPLLAQIGEDWGAGRLKVSHEHLASAVIRTFLGQMAEGATSDKSAPLLVVTTPAGQVHEFGALMSAVTAAGVGWRVAYLGPNLPAEDIAAAVRQTEATAVALSLVYPPDDPRLPGEFRTLRKLVGERVLIVAGGRARSGYRKVLGELGVDVIDDYRALSEVLGVSRLASASPLKEV